MKNMKRDASENDIPLSMTLQKESYNGEDAIRALHALNEAAQKNGTANMSLDEINAEIAAYRAERDAARKKA